MIAVLIAGMLVVAIYQYMLLKAKKAELRSKLQVYMVTFFIFAFLVVCFFRSDVVNPQPWLERLFGPLQDRIQLKR